MKRHSHTRTNPPRRPDRPASNVAHLRSDSEPTLFGIYRQVTGGQENLAKVRDLTTSVLGGAALTGYSAIVLSPREVYSRTRISHKGVSDNELAEAVHKNIKDDLSRFAEQQNDGLSLTGLHMLPDPFDPESRHNVLVAELGAPGETDRIRQIGRLAVMEPSLSRGPSVPSLELRGPYVPLAAFNRLAHVPNKRLEGLRQEMAMLGLGTIALGPPEIVVADKPSPSAAAS